MPYNSTLKEMNKKARDTIHIKKKTHTLEQTQGTILTDSATMPTQHEEYLSLQKNDSEYDLKLKEKSKQIKSLNKQLSLIEEKTRKSIAADLHDSVAQSLGWICSMVKNMRNGHLKNNKKNLSEIQIHLESAIQEIRSTIYMLNPPILDDFEINLTIGSLITEFFSDKKCEIHFSNELRNTFNMSKLKKITIYRAVSELIKNIAKHSNANNAFVKISAHKNIFKIEIRDDGVGFSTDLIEDKYSFGLSFIKERMECLEGDIKIFSKPNEGASIILSLPIES